MKTNVIYLSIWICVLGCFTLNAQTQQAELMQEVNESSLSASQNCLPGAGWIEQKLVPGQWNSVAYTSKLESNTSTHIYYINSNNQVCNLYKMGNLWQGDDILNSAFQKASPTGGILDQQGTYKGVYYVGTDQKIYRFNLTQYGWIANQVSSRQWNKTMLNSELAMNGYELYYINSERQVCNLWNDGSSWHDDILNSSAKRSVNNGRGLLWVPQQKSLYYVGDDYFIWSFYRINSVWRSQKVCNNQWNYVMPGTELISNSTGTEIFYINKNYYLCGLYKQSDGWHDAILNSSIKVNPNSHLTIKHGSTDIIYFIGANNNVYRAYYSNGWKYQMLIQTAFCQTLGKSGIKVVGDNIYYTGTDNYVHVLNYHEPAMAQWVNIGEDGFPEEFYQIKEQEVLFDNPESKSLFTTGNVEVSIYPNPATEFVDIERNEIKNEAVYQIYNMQGAKVKEGMMNKGEHIQRITLNGLHAGCYILKISDGKNMITKKFFIR